MIRQIISLLEDGSKVIGLKLCFRHIDLTMGLPAKWRLHVVPACLVHKNNPAEEGTCINFAEDATNRDMALNPDGMLRKCPFGYLDILTPVIVDGIYAGPLFAGPCWLEDAPPPHESLVVPPDKAWLLQRLSMLNCIAMRIAHIMRSVDSTPKLKRRQVIIGYIQEHLHEEVTLEGMAGALNLSPSRTTHLVKEIFDTSLPLLARQQKLLSSLADLVSTDQPIGDISRKYGFLDQNYFSRIFSESFGLSPKKYRLTHNNDA